MSDQGRDLPVCLLTGWAAFCRSAFEREIRNADVRHAPGSGRERRVGPEEGVPDSGRPPTTQSRPSTMFVSRTDSDASLGPTTKRAPRNPRRTSCCVGNRCRENGRYGRAHRRAGRAGALVGVTAFTVRPRNGRAAAAASSDASPAPPVPMARRLASSGSPRRRWDRPRARRTCLTSTPDQDRTGSNSSSCACRIRAPSGCDRRSGTHWPPRSPAASATPPHAGRARAARTDLDRERSLRRRTPCHQRKRFGGTGGFAWSSVIVTRRFGAR
jgi:hypothetical protein